MQRTGLRATIGGVETDVPTGTWTGGQFLRYNASTGVIDSAAGGGGGGITGPGSSVVGDIVTWNDTGGTTVADGGKQVSALVTGPPTVVSNRLAQFSGTSGTVLVDSGIPSVNAVTNVAGTAAVANVSQFTNTIGNDISDSGLPVAQIPRFTSAPTAGRVLFVTGTSPITMGFSSTYTNSNLPFNNAGSSTIGNLVSYATIGASQQQDSGVPSAQVITSPSPMAAVDNIVTAQNTSRAVKDSGVAISSLTPVTKSVLTVAGGLNSAVTTMQASTLTVSAAAAGVYQVEVYLVMAKSISPQTVTYGIASSTAPTLLNVKWDNYLSATTLVTGIQTTVVTVGAVGTTGFASGAKTGTVTPFFPTLCYGTIVLPSSSTVQVLVSQSTGTMTPQAGSFLLLTKIG